MIHRFNDATLRVLRLADEEAKRFCHDYLGTEHLLLGLARLSDCVAARVLAARGIELRHLRLEVEANVQITRKESPSQRPMTPRAKQVLRRAVEDANRLGLDRAGTGQVLLGLLEETDGVASQVLQEFGLMRVLPQILDLVRSETTAHPEGDGGADHSPPPLPRHLRQALDQLDESGPAPAGAEPVRLPLAMPSPEQFRYDPEEEDTTGVLLLGAVKGALGGFLWSLLVAIPLTILFWIEPAYGPRVALATGAGVIILWSFIAALSGSLQSREQQLGKDYQTTVQRHTRRAALQASLFATPVVLLILAATWGYNPGSAVMSALLVLGIWVGSASIVGYLRGTRAALEEHAQDASAALAVVAEWEKQQTARWDAGTLDKRRQELRHAIEARFGTLGNGSLDRLTTWEQDRLSEVGRKVGEAKSTGELGLDD